MNSKRRPSGEKLGQMLNTPHFGQTGDGSLPPTDPIVPTPMVLTLEQIHYYEHNPRRERNPRYEEIKESIHAQGSLNTPLTVTRRPGEEHFIIESGGNTRLEILNELFKETGDDTFFQLHVLFRPWQSETHVLSSHLIENEKRGDIIFIDKALAVQELKTMFEAENDETYTLRQTAERLKEVGYEVNSSLLWRMIYAANVLLPLIPEALRAGMGRPQIQRIRQIENAFQIYWTDYAGQDKADFINLFQDCLTEHDRPEWDNDTLIAILEERFVELLDIPVRSMRPDIDALLHGREIIPSAPDTLPVQWVNSTSNDDNDTSNKLPTKQHVTTNPSETKFTTTPVNETPDQPDTTELVPDVQQGTTKVPPPSQKCNDDDDELDDATPLTIEQARDENYTVVLRLARHYQLEQCIQPSSDWGLGFLIDLPRHPLIPDDVQTRNAKAQSSLILRQWLWWMLYVCSEETVQPERIANIPKSMAVRDLCLNDDQHTLMHMLGRPAWSSIAHQLLANPLLPDNDFKLLIKLIRRCRQLKSMFGADNDMTLWPQRNDDVPA